jgi:hypothetical protein
MIEELDLPTDLASDLERARRFAIDVHERRGAVGGEGAAAYINTVMALVQRLCACVRPRFELTNRDGTQSLLATYA